MVPIAPVKLWLNQPGCIVRVAIYKSYSCSNKKSGKSTYYVVAMSINNGSRCFNIIMVETTVYPCM